VCVFACVLLVRCVNVSLLSVCMCVCSPSLVADKPDVFGVLNHPYAPWVIADNPESAKHFAVSPAMKAYASEYHAQKNTQ
jgi:hypothetical protein